MSEVHEAVGSYVVDALDTAEREEFEAHLPSCDRCQVEVAEFSETIAELSSLVATEAPAELRTSILGAIAQTRPLAPDAVGLEHRAHLRARPAQAVLGASGFSTGEGRPLTLETGITDEVAPLEEHPSVVPDWSWSVPIDPPSEQEVGRGRRLQRVLTALVAAVVVVALALGGWVYALSQRNQAQTAATQLETELLSAPDARVLTSTVSGTSVVYVVSRERDQAMLLATNLTDPGESATYQLWTLKGSAATSAGLVPKGGSVRQWFSGSVREADALALTREDSPDGSATPTLPPLSRVSI